MKIERTLHPGNQDIDFLTHKINAEINTANFGTAYPFAFFIRDDNNNIIAGCNGSVIFGAIYTDQLWVQPEYRQQGLGRQLMQSIHDYGQSIGCTMAIVATMNFQEALPFYDKLGYKLEFERKGYSQGASHMFLRREL